MADGPALTIPGVEGLEEIGRGGMAVVYKGHQPAFSRDVAVKVVVVAGVDERIRSRFEQELQAVGGLSEHPNIISVHGEGVTDQGLPYLIMGFQPGGTLSDQMRDRGPIPWAEVAAIGVKMAGALESAHRAGVLHRDVKPENILVSSFGEPVLADFGIARLEGGAHLTASGIITGTPAHTAPEVMQGRAPTAASDVYGLASTLHQLLSGTPAFVKATDESTLAVLNRVLSEAPPDLRRGGVPAPLADVIDRGMAKEPAARFATAAEFGQALRGAQQTLGVAVTSLPVALEEGAAPDIGETVVVAGAVAPLPPTPVGFPGPPPPAVTPVPYIPPEGAARKPTWPWILAAAAVVIAVVAAVVLSQGGDDGGDAERFANAPDESTTTTEAPTTTTESPTTTTPTTTSTPPVTVVPPPPSVFGPPVDPATFIPEYGTDPSFDSRADSCYGGDLRDCDRLYSVTPVSAATASYEGYAATCGGRLADEDPGNCVVLGQSQIGSPVAPDDFIPEYGSNGAFDSLADSCFSGDFTDCDGLYRQTPVSPSTNSYEGYGATCGGRLAEEQPGICASLA